MRVIVKVLRGGDCVVEVSPNDRVADLKKTLERVMAVPIERQRLLLNGNLLLDTKTLAEYEIGNGTKLNLLVLRKTKASLKSYNPDVLRQSMTQFVNRYYNDSDTKKIVDAYMQEFYHSIENCNLDDWERIATGYLQQDPS